MQLSRSGACSTQAEQVARELWCMWPHHRSAKVARTMTQPACPICTLEEILSHSQRWECATCGHEWPKDVDAPTEAARVVKDANGTTLVDGDTVVLIKDLKLKGSSDVLKQGTKVRNIRLVDGDHEIDCRIDGSAMALKACFVKKA
jgi:protein PhnA